MGLKLNPLTAQFDLTGSGGGGGGASYIDGEVATYNDLPLDGTAPLNSAWLVRTASGVWPVSRKQAGIYIRTATGGSNRDADYTYAGTMPDVFSDSQFLLYDNTDTSKNLAFDLSGIDTGTTRTLTVPNASGTISLQGHTHVSANITDATSDETPNTIVKRDAYGNAKFNGIQVTDVTPPANEVWLAGFDAQGTIAAISPPESRDFIGLDTDDAVTFGSIQNTPIGSTTRSTGAFTTLSANNGTLTASAPVLDLSQTWNNAAVTFSGARIDITNTASATGSRFLECSVGGVAAIRLARIGSTPYALFGTADTGIGAISTSQAAIIANGGVALVVNSGSGGAYIRSDASYAWASGTNLVGASSDLTLARDAADTLAQRRTTNPQTFRLYNTYTDASNYERGFMRWSSNVLQIGTEKLGTGSARTLELQVDGTTFLGATTGGTVRFGSQSVQSTTLIGWFGNCYLRPVNASAGVLTLLNNALDGFDRLQFGGTTSSFPALKRSSTALQVRLADDSAFAPLECATLTTTGDATINGLVIGASTVSPTSGTRSYITSAGAGVGNVSSGVALFAGSSAIRWAVFDNGLSATRGDAAIGWSSSGAPSSLNIDTRLWRDAAGTVAIRNGATGQAFRIYNTDGTNFERLNLRWASNEFIIDAEAGGTGTLRGIKIGSATSSLLGFYGATPVDRPATVADPTGGGTIDAEARTAINNIIDRLQELGLIA